jgi:segregation and condensation protein A
MSLQALELDLDVFTGPFDLLLALVLREEVDLLELPLADVVIAYLDHLQGTGELELESATEFILLVAALLELKSRMMLTGEGEDLLELEPEQAAEELLARMFEAHRFRQAADHLRECLRREEGVRFRAAPLPAPLRRTILPPPDGSEDPTLLGEAMGDLLRMPPQLSLAHVAVPRVPVAERLAHLRSLLARGSFTFDEAVRGEDRMTVAVTLFALLELYKRGEVDWRQDHSFGEIAIRPRVSDSAEPDQPARARISDRGEAAQPTHPAPAMAG